MIVKVLTKSEYPKLAQIEEGFVPDPENSIAVCAFDGEEIVGRMFVVMMPHIEGTWIAPDKRGGTLGYRLEQGMVRELKARGVPKVLAYTANEHDADYMQRLGWAREPYTLWSKEV